VWFFSMAFRIVKSFRRQATMTTGEGEQANLWLVDLSQAIEEAGGRLSPGMTLPEQTVSIVPASLFAPRAGLADLVKANLGHGLYALPQANPAG
jgi:hypothetical protein